MKVAVFGGSGGTGRLVIGRLLDREDEVVALVRDRARIEIENERLDVRIGDAFDLAAVDSVVDGCDAVISLLGTRLDQPVDAIRTQGTGNVITAMVRHGVRRLVVVSGAGGSGSAQQMGAFTRWLYRRKVGAERFAEVDRLEELVAASDLDWTVVRPPRLVDERTKSPPIAEPSPKVPLSAFLTREDLAEILVAQATGDGDHRTALTALSTRG